MSRQSEVKNSKELKVLLQPQTLCSPPRPQARSKHPTSPPPPCILHAQPETLNPILEAHNISNPTPLAVQLAGRSRPTSPDSRRCHVDSGLLARILCYAVSCKNYYHDVGFNSGAGDLRVRSRTIRPLVKGLISQF